MENGTQVKSEKIVADHGEVFTEEREAPAMLDLIKQDTENKGQNACPIHGMLSNIETAILTVNGIKHNITVSLCSFCMKYYSSSKLLPSEAKMLYKGLPLVKDRFFENGAKAVFEEPKSPDCISPSNKNACMVSCSIPIDETKRIILYIIPEKIEVCPVCNRELSMIDKPVRVTDGMFKKIQGRQCISCHRLYVLASVYKQLARYHTIDADVIWGAPTPDVPQSKAKPKPDTETAIVSLPSSERISVDKLYTADIKEDLLLVKISDVFFDGKYTTLVNSLEHDGYYTLGDLKNLKKLLSYVSHLGCYSWQDTLKIVAEINSILMRKKQVRAITSPAQSNAYTTDIITTGEPAVTKSVDLVDIPIEASRQLSPLDTNLRRQQFEAWMKQVKRLSDTSSYRYSITVEKCCAFALKHGYSALSLFSIKCSSDISDVINALLADKVFNQYNEKYHHLLSAALHQYLDFVSQMVEMPAYVNSDTASDSAVIKEKEIVLSLLAEYFPNGIRPHSIIDINKLKALYSDVTGQEIVSLDIPALLDAVGIRHGEKLFAILPNDKHILTELLQRLIAEGHRLFYYSEFYSAFSVILQTMNIFSVDLLKAVLVDLYPSLHFTKGYFCIKNNATIEGEVIRCFDAETCLSYEEIKGKLPYIPIEKIKQVLAQNNDFIWVHPSAYTHISKIEIVKEECEMALVSIRSEISQHGYVSLAALQFPLSIDLNPTLSDIAVKNGIFRIYFSDLYEKRGNILSPKGTALTELSVFEDFCLSHDRLTFDELQEFEKSVNGSVHSQALFVAYDTMIRADKTTFVSDGMISFDIDKVDHAISLFIRDDVIPIRAVTSFTNFPCIEGYSWNLFLLESYCKRFSKQFRFQCLSVSSRNVGAIFRRSVGYPDYSAVLAAAVSNASINLETKDVGDFLFESGYVAQRTSTITDIITQARVLRERRT